MEYIKNQIIQFVEKQRDDISDLCEDEEISLREALQADKMLQEIEEFIVDYRVKQLSLSRSEKKKHSLKTIIKKRITPQ